MLPQPSTYCIIQWRASKVKAPATMAAGTDPIGQSSMKPTRCIAQETRKPIFGLTAADGVVGAQYTAAAREAGRDCARLADAIVQRAAIPASPRVLMR